MDLFGILIVLQKCKFWKFGNFRNWKNSEIELFYGFVHKVNLMISEIVGFGKFSKFENEQISKISEFGHLKKFQIFAI